MRTVELMALNAGARCATNNGTNQIKGVRMASGSDGTVEVTGISRQFSRVLTPSIVMRASEMDELCRLWIESRQPDIQAASAADKAELRVLLDGIVALASRVADRHGIALNGV